MSTLLSLCGRHLGVFLAILRYERVNGKVVFEHLGDIGYPALALEVALVLYREKLFVLVVRQRGERVERDLYALLSVLGVNDGNPRDGDHERGHALLTVYQYLFPGRTCCRL